MSPITVGAPDPSDVARILEITAEQNEPEDVEDARLTLEGPIACPDDWMVAKVGGAVAAFALAIPILARVGSVELPALSAELVATAPGFEGQGLQRRVFDAMTERWSDRPIHMIVGIPYFYRRLGYEYAIPNPNQQVLPGLGLIDGWECRAAGIDDVDRVIRLQAQAQAVADVAFAHSRRLWEWIVSSPLYRTVLVRRGGEEGMARGYRYDDTCWVMEAAGTSNEAVAAAVGAAADGHGGEVRVYHRPGVPAIADLGGTRHEAGYAYYLRVGDPVAALGLLAPELSRRLAVSRLAGHSGDVLLSFYRSSATLTIESGTVVGVTEGPGVPAPVSRGGSGVPPDLVAHLLLGPLGAAGLARRHADVLLGKQEELMAALFPPLTTDLHTWVAP